MVRGWLDHLLRSTLRRFGRLPSLLAAALFATVLAGAPAAQSAPAGPPHAGAAVALPTDDNGPATNHDTSPPLGSLHPGPVPAEHGAVPLRRIPHPTASGVKDTVVQRGRPARAAAVPVLTQFDGIAGNNNPSPLVPPDPNAAVGSTQIVETANLNFAVYSKTGSTIIPPMSTNTVWQGFGGPCETTDDGDATVRWDTLANRWIITQLANAFSNVGPFYECVAVSTTDDATGTYYRYSFQYADFNDYPKLAVWPDAYYVTYNMFNPDKTAFLGAKVCALDRAQMLSGGLATQQCFDTSSSYGGLLASDLDGPTPPPSGEPNLLVALGQTNTTLAYWKFHVDFTNPGLSTFTGPTALTVDPYTVACASDITLHCIPQGGTSQLLDSLSDRMMYRLAYRNFGSYESLVVNHAVEAGTSVGVRWYEFRLPGGNPTVFQQGTYAPDSTFRWMGSIAEDKVGNIALGYSQSSASTNPAIQFTGRLATDTPGTLPLGETTVITGGGSQTVSERWGDYTSMAVDPTDDCTLWYTNQYQPTNGAGNWHTRLASFVLPNCVQPSDFSLSLNPSSATVTAGDSANSTVSTAVTSGGAQQVALSASGLPAGATASFNPSSVTAGSSSAMTVSTSASTPPGIYTITVTGTGTSATHSATFTLTVNAPSDFSLSLNPTSATVTAGDSANSTVSTAVTSGSAQQVALSASGLPAGATASFNPSTVTAGSSSA
ncbi:hypothetical protein ABT173_01025, partial [Streptomyces sp. NPDC001795]